VIKNSENEFNCWFIENPMSKELQKKISVKIGPNQNQEFIIVVKAPKNKLTERIVSFIEVNMEEQPIINQKQIDHKSSKVVSQKKIINNIEVLLLGYLDNPRIKCMKQLFNKSAQSDVVSLAVKKASGIQRFKLPFKNLSTYLDSDIEFAFIRTAQSQFDRSQNAPPNKDPIDCLSFYCQPNQIKIAAEQIQILTV
jgi:hypothetical protein